MTVSPSTARLRCEFQEESLTIDNPRPRFDWVNTGDPTAAVVSLRRADNGVLVWSHVVPPGVTWCTYDGQLDPLTAYAWTVTPRQGEPCTSSFATGLLGTEWPALWIGADLTKERTHRTPDATDVRSGNTWLSQPTRTLTSNFEVEEAPARALLHATALGCYQASINGVRAGRDELAPGWSDYDQHVYYQCYDITSLLVAGTNAISILLGDGWYAGYVGYNPKRRGALWGQSPAASAFVTIESPGDSRIVAMTGPEWRYIDGPARYADILMGTSWDARSVEVDAQHEDDWTPVQVRPTPRARLVGQSVPSVTVTERLTPVAVQERPDGSVTVDFGQNFAGRVRLTTSAAAGTLVTLRHAEALQGDGTLYTDNLRAAEATDLYVAAGSGLETFAPPFTYHGFRYAHVEGTDVAATTTFRGEVLHNPMHRTGTFDCGHQGVNKVYENVWWSQRSNFVSVPTDCPQRDERLGWLADAHVFGATAAYNADTAAFMRTWLREVRAAQSVDGAFPDVAPRANHPFDGAPGWADGAAILTAQMLDFYDDVATAEAMYRPLQAWLDLVTSQNPTLIRRRKLGNNYGDWLSVGSSTPPDLVSTAYFVHSVDQVGRIAARLGHEADHAQLTSLADDIREAFRKEFMESDGALVGDTQAGYVMALAFHLVSPSDRPAILDRLVDAVDREGQHLTTGFLTTRHLLPVLADEGRADLAYALLLQRTAPSWLATVERGATTMWERWDATDGEGTFAPPLLNSMNHYAFGSVGEFLYRYAAGINQAPGSSGFRDIILQPHPHPGLGHVSASYEALSGLIESRWAIDYDGLVELHVTTPKAARARLQVPDGWHLPSAAPNSRDGRHAVDLPGGTTRLVLEPQAEVSAGR